MYDGNSQDGHPYRMYNASSATWLYVELFSSQAAADNFCKAAGGALAAPATLAELMEVLTLVNATVLGTVHNADTTERSSLANFSNNKSLYFALWMANNLTNITNATTGGDVMPIGVWPVGQPSNMTQENCTVMLVRQWTNYWPNWLQQNPQWLQQNPQPATWVSWPCNTSEWNEPLPAICKLPTLADGGVPQFLQGELLRNYRCGCVQRGRHPSNHSVGCTDRYHLVPCLWSPFW
jgi:hypothetical protein